jgi:CDP-diacylglycerol--glycerol-3-phosphate 3-phosphatidyltransferase/cardiolipin synthase
MMSEGSPASEGEQGGLAAPARRGARFTAADAFTVLRFPLALAFLCLPEFSWRFGILMLAAGTDLLDGFLARRFGSSRFGDVLDPVADKVFMAVAFTVVAVSRRLEFYEIAGVLLRDLTAAGAFLATVLRRRPTAIPARLGGKAVTVGQILTLFAFVAGSNLLRPLAWATAGMGLYAVWDYSRAAPGARRRL